ncbi:ATP-binding protein [Phenylobacterium aquaticum]|uniref:ATP-binding protein n=1 Tax=Phenylobacterium aquaticum TaxID=1763816 RepID=UPI0026E9785E|nr:ATP-binding protein [Phenylobacterium aquaticum]
MSRTAAFSIFKRTMALIGSGADLSGALEAIVRMVEAEDPTILCSILLRDETGTRLAPGAAPSLPDFYNNAIHGLEIGPNVGSCGTAIFTGQRVVVTDVQTDPLWAPYRDLAGQAGLAACWSEPIRLASGEVVGSFAIYHREVSRPSDDDVALIEAAAELGALAIARDRTDAAARASETRAREAADREVEAARELMTFFDMSADLLCIINDRGRFVRLSRAWEQVLGWPVESLVGQSYLPLMHEEDRATTIAEGRRFLEGHAVFNHRNRYRHRDGSYRVLEWQARPSGERVYAVARDVTEQSRVEAETAAAREAAERANQAKSDFLANMSHEIRTPLNGVIGVVDALARTELTVPQREMVDLVRGAGATLTRLVSDILDLSKIEAGGLELELGVFDLGETLSGGLAVARLNAEAKGLAFTARFGPTARGRFQGDGVRLRQVVGNLLSNAMKFTAAGEVMVEVEVTEPAQGNGPAQFTCAVRDTGVGFDAELADHLFERFNQADSTMTRRYGGSGLGLAICKSLVEMMGGQISAHSRPGEGSTFSFSLPLTRDQALADYDIARQQIPSAARAAEEAEAETSQGGRALHVLLAEDNLANQKVVELLLSPFDIVLTTVDNGAQAVDALRSEPFDLVLMDLQMPVMDGLTATRAIRRWEAEQAWPAHVPIVVLSANAMAHHCAEALEAGADLHVAKPLTGDALLAGIEKALDSRAA